MSVHDKVIQNSKEAAINWMEGMFEQMEFDPIELSESRVISHVGLSHIDVDPDQIEIRISHDRLIVHCQEFGAHITGHSSNIKKASRWGKNKEETNEQFDFMGHIQKGGLEMDLEFVMDH
jgi:hypothetical protein